MSERQGSVLHYLEAKCRIFYILLLSRTSVIWLVESFPIIDLWLFVSCIEKVNSYLPFHEKLFAHIQFVNVQV